MDASAYALAHGLQRTRSTLQMWRARPLPVLRRWVAQSLAVAVLLLLATWVIALLGPSGDAQGVVASPPLALGTVHDGLRILVHNLLVLALHAMACVAGFIAGSSLPLQAESQTGFSRWVHDRGRVGALAFVVAATSFSLCMQAYTLGRSVSLVAGTLHASPGLLLLTLLPHALPELVALFLPLAAWISASRRGEWEQLLAATVVSSALALPILLATAAWEVYGAPHLIHAVIGGG